MPENTLRLATRSSSSPGGRGGRTRRRRPIALLVIVGLVALAGVGAWSWWKGSVGPLPVREHCTAIAAKKAAELDPEQAGNAAIIAAVANKRGLPARAASIGIATAMQESKLRNISYGDRDSLGLFQQRPSQGWGTRKQISDPVYASNAFYDVLSKIDGYETMSITKVAQKVQRSAFPEAYAEHEPEAKVISSTLTGFSPAGFSCVLRASTAAAQTADSSGLTARARAVKAAADKEAGRGTATVVSPTVIRFSVPASTGDRQGWALAQWAVARADSLGVIRVEVAGQVWDRKHSTDGWTKSKNAQTDGVTVQVA